MEHSESLLAALTELSALLGDAAVVRHPAAEHYLRCTTGVQRRVPAIVFAASADEIAAVLDVARRHRVPVYPVSTGNNWGYGTSNPVADGTLILNLSRMNRVLDFQADTGLITVEPGVTQGALAAFLERAGNRYMVPTTGAGPSASILGNALERGYGITPHADHFAALTALEAVLADGQLYRSPLASLGAAAGFKWGIGPYLDGLFTQGAFGVVTQATIALARRPEHCEVVLFRLRADDDLEPAVEAVRDCLADLPGTVGGINLMNAHRVLAMTAPYPWDRVGAQGVLPQDSVVQMARAYQVAPWTGFGTLYGTRRMVAAARSELRGRLRRLARVPLFLSPARVRMLHAAAGAVPRVTGRFTPMLGALAKSLDLVRGMPNETALPLAYWRNRKGLPSGGQRLLDPARDGCGLYWYAPLVEMTPARTREFVQFVTGAMPSFGMEPLLTLTTLSDRCFGSTVPILFDRDDEDDCKRARACYADLMEAGLQRGYFPYRLGIDSMDWLTQRIPGHWRLVAQLKAGLDPHGLISPGRYAPLGKA